MSKEFQFLFLLLFWPFLIALFIVVSIFIFLLTAVAPKFLDKIIAAIDEYTDPQVNAEPEKKENKNVDFLDDLKNI